MGLVSNQGPLRLANSAMTSRSALSENTRIDPILHSHNDLSLLAQALFDERKNLMVFPSPLPALSETVQSLQQHLVNQTPSVHLVHFSGQHPAAMLGKINEGLVQQSLIQGVPGEPGPSPDAFWFVHDAQYLQSDELRLLLQLNDHFPNWRVRWVLLFDVTPNLTTEQKIWMDQASSTWLKWPSQASAPWGDALASDGNENASVATRPNLKNGAMGTAKPGLKAWLLLTSGLATLLLGAWWYGPSSSMDSAGPSVSQARRADMVESPLPAIDTSNSDLQKTPEAELKPISEDTNNAAAPFQNEVSGLPQPSTAPKLSRQMPDVAARGYQWLQSLPRESFVLQHGSFDTATQAQRSGSQNTNLRGARVVMLKPSASQTPQFVLVSGPFRSQDRALNFKKKNKLPDSTSIEPITAILQKSMAPQQPRQGQPH